MDAGGAEPRHATRFRDDLRRGDVRGLTLDGALVALRCVLPLALRTLPLPTALRLLETVTPRAEPPRAHVAIARAEALASRLGVPDTCFYRAMVRWAALRNAGINAVFTIGVRGQAPDAGHAWVDVDGAPVGERADPDLVPTYRFRGAASDA